MMKTQTKKLVTMGALIALNIILANCLGIHTWNLKISFAFLTVFLAACLFGPLGGGVVAALSDILGVFLFPVGAFFPAFTVTAFVSGLVNGLVFRNGIRPRGILLVACVDQLVLSLLINTYWISVIYGTPYTVLFATRSIQCAVMAPIEIVLLIVFRKYVPSFQRLIAG